MSKLEVDAIEPQSGTTLTLGASGDTINVASGATNNLGITMVDQWRLTASLTGDAAPISSNLERVDSAWQGTLGTGMTESSGIFTFPQTGLYLVRFVANFQRGSGNDAAVNYIISATTDNSTYNDAARVIQNSGTITNGYNQVSTETTIDVTDTSTHKVRFDITSTSGYNSQTSGNSTLNYTCMTFIRLGDT